jgi:hypothetical protein
MREACLNQGRSLAFETVLSAILNEDIIQDQEAIQELVAGAFRFCDPIWGSYDFGVVALAACGADPTGIPARPQREGATLPVHRRAGLHRHRLGPAHGHALLNDIGVCNHAQKPAKEDISAWLPGVGTSSKLAWFWCFRASRTRPGGG